MILAVTPVATFNQIAKLANLTPGNLGTHLKGLEAIGYVEAHRTLVDLKPRLRYRMTEAGREALRVYCHRITEAARGIEGLLVAPPQPASSAD